MPNISEEMLELYMRTPMLTDDVLAKVADNLVKRIEDFAPALDDKHGTVIIRYNAMFAYNEVVKKFKFEHQFLAPKNFKQINDSIVGKAIKMYYYTSLTSDDFEVIYGVITDAGDKQAIVVY